MPDDFLFDTSGAVSTSTGGGGFDFGDLTGLITGIGNTFANVFKAVNTPTAIALPGTTAANKPAPTVTPTTTPAVGSLLSSSTLTTGLVIGAVAFGLSRLGR